MKIVFFDETSLESDFLWMRGSKTEPVFRILVDCEGSDRKRHDNLLEWHSSLIREADERATEKDTRGR